MIASRLGLSILAALALLLAIVVAIDLSRDDGPVSHALVTGFDAEKVTRLAWARAGEQELVVERSAGAWKWTKPVAGIPAEAAAIDAVFAALRGGRWHRRASRGQAGLARVTLSATAGTKTWKLTVGAPLEGAGQTWLAIDGSAFLVDDWIARALSPDPLALRDTRPLRDAATANTIVIERAMQIRESARIEGQRLVRPIEIWLAPGVLKAIHEALTSLTITSTPSAPPRGRVAATISIDGPPLTTIELYEDGSCSLDEIEIRGTIGRGCVASKTMTAVLRLFLTLQSPLAEIADPRMIPFEPVAITFPDGAVLDLKAKPRIGDRDADPAAILELMTILQTPVPIVAADPAKPIGTLVAVDRAGTKIELDILPKQRVRRRAEGVVFQLGEGGIQILARPSSALRNTTLWREDPTTIKTITIDSTTYTRGAVVGEWTRVGPGKPDADAASSLAMWLSALQGTDLAKPPTAKHTITFETAPPSGPPVKRTFTLGDRCEAVVDGKPVAFDKRVCDEIARLLP